MADLDDRKAQADPLIDEVRSIRKAISDQFGNDVDRLCDYLQQREAEHKDRIAGTGGADCAEVGPDAS